MNAADVIKDARKVLADIECDYLVERGYMGEEVPDTLTALIALVEEQAEQIGHLVQARAEQADEAENWRGRHTRLTEMRRAVAAVTPCSCSAQRARADRAEAALARVRALLTGDYGKPTHVGLIDADELHAALDEQEGQP